MFAPHKGFVPFRRIVGFFPNPTPRIPHPYNQMAWFRAGRVRGRVQSHLRTTSHRRWAV